jgi:TIR domain
LKVFINYRHDDTDAAALLLWDRLAQRYGAGNVFLDVKSLEAGTKWLEEIKSHGSRGAAVLALIGRDWLAALQDRRRLEPGDPEDYVVLELELALGRWPGTVIPVLIGGASMPEAVACREQSAVCRRSRGSSFVMRPSTRIWPG